jgi:catechol 2,3-dioxygenase-like lactoylglutathione lyase family enzyme
MKPHVNAVAANPLQRPAVLDIGFMTRLYVRLESCMLAAIRGQAFIRNCFGSEGKVDGSKRHRACFSDRVEFRTLSRVLSQAAAVSRHEAGHRYRRGLLRRRRPHGGRDPRAPEHAGSAFEQNRVGLHHLCFRARERADIDDLHGFLCSLGVTVVRAPREDKWAPGYYSLLFEDPDGIRLELNHVPGKGLLT